MWKSGSFLGGLAFSFSLAAAALAQPAAPAQVPAPPAPNVTKEPTLPEVNDPMLTPPPPAKNVLRTWQEALRRLRDDSTNLRTSRARIQQAEAQARIALSGALPALTANAGVTHHLLRGEGTVLAANGDLETRTIPDPATRFDANLTLRVPVFAPETWFNHGTAKDAIETTRLDAKEIERLEIAGAANTIVTVVTAERLAEVSRVSLRSALSTLDLNKRRAALGASSAVDVLRAEQEVALSRAQVVATDESLLRAREALGTALGSAEPWGVTTEIRLDALAGDARASCHPESTIEARPDVKAARSAAEVAERDVRGVGYGYLPRVDAVSVLAWSEPESPANDEALTWTIGGVLTWELYDGGLRYGTRGARRAEAALSRERLTDTRRRATLQVSQSLRGVRVAEANLAVSAQRRTISSEFARLTKVAYLNGSGTSFDLVDSARQLREAELDLTIREFEVLQAKITALLALATCRV